MALRSNGPVLSVEFEKYFGMAECNAGGVTFCGVLTPKAFSNRSPWLERSDNRGYTTLVLYQR